MSTFLPDLTLKYSKRLNNENKNENNNNISQTQTVIINKGEPFNVIKEETDPLKIKDLVEKIRTPENITQFKETFLEILINYFTDEYVLLQNIIEFSKKIVMKEADLKKLIAILVTDGDSSRINIEYDIPEKLSKCCVPCTKNLIYQEIKSIIIDNKNVFQFFYNQFHTQMSNVFNISLDYILPNN
jgi:hypothetical protein